VTQNQPSPSPTEAATSDSLDSVTSTEVAVDAGTADGASADEPGTTDAGTHDALAEADEAAADASDDDAADPAASGTGAADSTSTDDGSLAGAVVEGPVEDEELGEVLVGDEVVVDDATMRRALEAILMVSDEPLPVLTLARAVGRPTGDVSATLSGLAEEYTEQGRGFDLREVGGGWRYYTREEAAQYVERFVLDGQQARLTQAALETLAVVAYKQPVSRARVSAIRGVNVDGVMRTLISRGLVEEAGADTESQATLYRTTSYFLERMGMQSLDDLPELAPYLPEMDDMEEELAAQAASAAAAETAAEAAESAAAEQDDLPQDALPETEAPEPELAPATDEAITSDVGAAVEAAADTDDLEEQADADDLADDEQPVDVLADDEEPVDEEPVDPEPAEELEAVEELDETDPTEIPADADDDDADDATDDDDDIDDADTDDDPQSAPPTTTPRHIDEDGAGDVDLAERDDEAAVRQHKEWE
jgi:segregation and condensation protein B